VQEETGIIEEDALDAKCVGVEKEHAEQNNRKDKARNSNTQFPTSVLVVETKLLKHYFDLVTRVRTPKAIKLKKAKMNALAAASLGLMWTQANHNKPRPNATITVHQKAV
jgi:hypothetical protein